MKNIKEIMTEFDNILVEQLGSYGFKKKRKHVFVRKQGDCLQHISIQETKVRGEEKVHIIICVGFTYEQINKLISFIRNETYDAGWATANINVSALIHSKVPYGFYIDENTKLEYVIEDIMQVVVGYSLNFLESCNTMEKYEEKLLDKEENVIKSTYTLQRPEWNLLALSLILGNTNVEEIFREYEVEFNKNQSLVEIAREKIKEYGIRGE